MLSRKGSKYSAAESVGQHMLGALKSPTSSFGLGKSKAVFISPVIIRELVNKSNRHIQQEGFHLSSNPSGIRMVFSMVSWQDVDGTGFMT